MVAPGTVTQWERATRLQAELDAHRRYSAMLLRSFDQVCNIAVALACFVMVAFAVGYSLGVRR